MSHHVTCHVTAMSYASSSSLKRKIKRNSKKRNIKSRKIDKRERKMLVSKRSITVDYFVLGTLSSSLVLLNTRVVLSLKHFEL